MDVRAVDPRDQTWEISRPKYRVYFHDETGAANEYAVEGADVAEVMAWAEAQRNGRTVVCTRACPATDSDSCAWGAVIPTHADRGMLGVRGSKLSSNQSQHQPATPYGWA